MNKVFKKNTLKVTSLRISLIHTSKRNHKWREKGITIRSGMRIRLWQKQKKNNFHQEINYFERKGHTEEDYQKLYPNKHTNHFQNRKKKKALIIEYVKDKVENTLYIEGKVSLTTLQKEIVLVCCVCWSIGTTAWYIRRTSWNIKMGTNRHSR